MSVAKRGTLLLFAHRERDLEVPSPPPINSKKTEGEGGAGSTHTLSTAGGTKENDNRSNPHKRKTFFS